MRGRPLSHLNSTQLPLQPPQPHLFINSDPNPKSSPELASISFTAYKYNPSFSYLYKMASVLARYKLVFHVPPAALDACKTAIFAAGAGRYPGSGNYTECCFTVLGTGQFRPGDAANPHIGKVGELEHVEEARVETLCVGEEVARKAVAALKK